MSIDYDLFVINAENQNTTPEQFRDCVYDALQRLDERLNIIESLLKKGIGKDAEEDNQGHEVQESKRSREKPQAGDEKAKA